MRLTSLLKKLFRLEVFMFLALSGGSLLRASDKNWFVMDGKQSTIFTEGPVAKTQTDLFYVTCWVTLVIFIIVGAVLAYATFKFKARNEADEHAEPPPQSHGNPLVELGLIAGSVLALVVIAIPTVKGIWFTYDVPGGETRAKFDELVQKGEAYEVTATGLQWWFKFEYPSEQINGVGPLVTANELVVPAGKNIRVNLRTTDVIHSFWIPKLAGKVDMIPNRANLLWFKADKPGYYWGQCAEYCGDSHAVMRFRVIALGPKDYNDWLDAQLQAARATPTTVAAAGAPRAQFAALRTFKQNEAGITEKFEVTPLESWKEKQFPEKNEDAALITQGRELFADKSCMNCHTVRGHSVMRNGTAVPFGGITAPDLTHVGSRSTIAGGLLENNREQLHRWIHDPGAVKPGNKMSHGIGAMAGYLKKDDSGKWVPNITLTTAEEVALVSYLESLK
jgi:cytochrome c oxidase subunit II